MLKCPLFSFWFAFSCARVCDGNSHCLGLLWRLLVLLAYRREQKGKKGASELKKKDKDQKGDAEDPEKNRGDENEEEDERMEEEEQNEEEGEEADS